MGVLHHIIISCILRRLQLAVDERSYAGLLRCPCLVGFGMAMVAWYCFTEKCNDIEDNLGTAVWCKQLYI